MKHGPALALICATLVTAASCTTAPPTPARVPHGAVAPQRYAPDPLHERIRMLSAQHLRQCWQAPIDLPNPERLIVVVQFNLAPDGTLNGAPRVTSPQNYRNDAPMRTAAERAVTAVERCSPYPFVNDPELANHYEAWGDLEFTFAPRP